jgi:hypothetical protein
MAMPDVLASFRFFFGLGGFFFSAFFLCGCAQSEKAPHQSIETRKRAPTETAPKATAKKTLAPNAIALPHHVLVKVEENHTLLLDDVITERIEAAPPDYSDGEAYPTGSGVTVTVQWDGQGHTFSRLSQGYESVEEIWLDGYRLRLGRIQQKPLMVEVFLDRLEKGESRAFTVKKGERISLDAHTDMRFDSHSHKRTRAGQSSPLMLNLVFLEDGAPVEAKTFSLHLKEERSFSWRNFRFELMDHQYDQSMTLKVDPGRWVPVKRADTP